MLKSVRLKDLKPNHFRDERVDPIDDEAVDRLADSIRQFGFKSGGVTVRKMSDGELHISAGHHRVAAAIKAGIKEAVVEVETIDDDTEMRWLAQENATQRGQSSTAGLGSIIGAIMVLAPRIMKGELDKLPPRYITTVGTKSRKSKPEHRTQRDLDKLQAHLTTEHGVGRDIICDFLHGIPGFTINSVHDYLQQVKGTGAYARTITEIADRVEKEQTAAKLEAHREAKRREQEAEREAQAAAKREAEAIERAEKAKAKDKAEHDKAEVARKAAKKAHTQAKKKKESATKARSSSAADRAERAKTSAKQHTPTLSEKVAVLFSNKEQVRVFFEAVANIGTRMIPVDEQVGLAQQIIKRAADWPGRPREVSTTFIREQISEIVFHKKHAARRADEAERKAASDRDYLKRAFEMLHQLDRDLERFKIQGHKLMVLMDDHADVKFDMKDRVLLNFANARDLIDEFLERAKRQRDPENVTRLRIV